MTASQLRPWRQRAIDAFLVVSFFFIGFFSASGDAATDQDRTEQQKTEAPMKHIIVLGGAS